MIHNGIFSLILDGVLVTPRKPNYKEITENGRKSCPITLETLGNGYGGPNKSLTANFFHFRSDFDRRYLRYLPTDFDETNADG